MVAGRGGNRGEPRHQSGGRGRGRGGRGRDNRDKKKTSKEDLDKELESFLMKDEEGHKRVTELKRTELDGELESYMAAQAGALSRRSCCTSG